MSTYKYKSIEISFINDIEVSNLCAFDDYYYFESDELLENVDQISDEEFEEAISKIVHIEPEYVEPEPQPTQLDIIQAAVEKSNNELRQEGAQTIIIELIDRGIL